MFNVVLVATDGSEAGDAAMSFAKDLALDQKARIFVVHVDELMPGHGGAHHSHALEPEIQTRIKGQVAALQADGLDAQFEVYQVGRAGPPTPSPTPPPQRTPRSSSSAASAAVP